MNIIWKQPDNSVAVTHLANPSASPSKEAEMLKSRGDIPADWEMVATAITLPDTREWRDAWSWTTPDPVIDICPIKAADLTKERLRKEREPLLASLDIQFMKALEQGQDTSAIVAEKQRLRDITDSATSNKSLEQLKAIKC